MNDKQIFTDLHADMLKASATKPYRPSNGTEGEIFTDCWCERCIKQEACLLPLMAMGHSITEPEYPKEWQYGSDGQPCCTAFKGINEK